MSKLKQMRRGELANCARRDLAMELRRLGDSGLKISEIGLGCNNFGVRVDQETTKAVVAAALDAGINFFDTANV